jgi:hypothetical protein
LPIGARPTILEVAVSTTTGPPELLLKVAAARSRDDVLSEAFFRERQREPRLTEVRRPMARRLAVRLLIVLALLVISDLLVRALLPPEDLLEWTPPEEAAYTLKVSRFEEGPAPDILFLGSSRVRDGVVPEVFSSDLVQRWGRPARTYNLGLNNAKAEEYLSVVRSHLPDPPPPRVVLGITGSEVVQVDGFQFASRYLWTLRDAADWWQRCPSESRDMAQLENLAESELGRLWYVFGHRDALREALTDALRGSFGWFALDESERQHRDAAARKLREHVLAEDGYLPPEAPQLESLAVRLQRDPGAVHVPPRELNAAPVQMAAPPFTELRALAALLAERNCRLAVVETPVSPWLQELNPVLHGDVFRQRMSELADELGIVWVPMPERTTHLTNSCYTDASHLSVAGARRYTRLLFRALDDAGFLQDSDP